jgi:hypothetical protein
MSKGLQLRYGTYLTTSVDIDSANRAIHTTPSSLFHPSIPVYWPTPSTPFGVVLATTIDFVGIGGWGDASMMYSGNEH